MEFAVLFHAVVLPLEPLVFGFSETEQYEKEYQNDLDENYRGVSPLLPEEHQLARTGETAVNCLTYPVHSYR